MTGSRAIFEVTASELIQIVQAIITPGDATCTSAKIVVIGVFVSGDHLRLTEAWVDCMALDPRKRRAGVVQEPMPVLFGPVFECFNRTERCGDLFQQSKVLFQVFVILEMVVIKRPASAFAAW